MTSEDQTGDAQYAIQAIVEGDPRTRTTLQPYGPGPYVYWYLAHHLTPDAILFADWFCTPQSDFNSRSGTIFVVTSESVIFADFEGAIEEENGDRNQNYGTVSTRFHSRTTASEVTVIWSDRSLDAKRAKLSKGSISVTAATWSVKLPYYDRGKDGDEYFVRLRAALGLG